MKLGVERTAERVKQLLRLRRMDLESATTALSLLVHDFQVARMDGGLFVVKGHRTRGYGRSLLRACVSCLCTLLGC